MDEKTHYTIVNAAKSNNVIDCLASFTIVVSLIVVYGWVFNVPVLTSLYYGWVSMKINTAFCLLFLGGSVWLRCLSTQDDNRSYYLKSSYGLAFIVLGVSLLTIGEYLFHSNWGVDEWLAAEPLNAVAYNHGRMAFITALDLCILSLALLFWRHKVFGRVYMGRMLSGLAAYIALTHFIGYAAGVGSTIQIGSMTTVNMALHTSSTLLALSIGVFMLYPRQGLMEFITDNTLGSLAVKRLLPVIFIVIPVLRWLITQGQVTGLYNSNIGAMLMISTTLVLLTLLVISLGKMIHQLDQERQKAQHILKDLAVWESEKRFSAIFHQAATGIAQVALDGTWLQVNQQFCNMVGYSEQELRELTFQDLTYPDDLEIDLNLAHQLTQGTIETYTLEKRYVRKDGILIWVNLTASMVRDIHQQPEYYIAVIQDVNLRKQAEAALKQAYDEMEERVKERTQDLVTANHALEIEVASRQAAEIALKQAALKFQAIFNQTFQFIGLLSPEGIVLEANQTALSLYQIAPEVVIGQFFWNTPWWSHSIREQERLKAAICYAAQGKFIRFITQHPALDGQLLSIDFSLKPIFDEAGHVLFLIPEGRDITEQQRIEEALRESEERSRLLIEGVKDYAIFMLDPEGYITTWNSGTERITGYRSEEIIGQHFSIFYPLDLIQQGHPDNELKQAKKYGKYEEEGWRIRKNNEPFWASVAISALYNDEDELLGFVKVTRDRTERKQLEEARNKMFEQLQENIVLRRNFVSTLTHDLRTPLIAQKRVLDVLTTETAIRSEPRLTEILQSFLNNNESLLKMVNTMLEVYQYEEGVIHPLIEPLNLSEFTAETVQPLQELAQSQGIQIENRISPDLQTCYADSSLLKRVWENLIGNAVANCPSGTTVVITAEGLESAIQIQVADNGPGISPELLPHLFDRYHSGQNTRRKIGSGLGLYICKMIMELHGGRIEVESTLQKGTTFSMVLPKQYHPVKGTLT